MRRIFQKAILAFDLLRLTPLIFIFYMSSKKDFLLKERNVWIEVIKHSNVYSFKNFIWLLRHVPEYRNVIYFRLTKSQRFFLNFFAKERESSYLNIESENVGVGLVLQHGFSTIVEAVKIGKNCQIWHNVTIGTNKSGSGNKATIGDNVKICAGAMVLGKILIGNNVTIGAGAVIVKDVPSNSVVVGNPAFIVSQNGEKCRIKL